ncbi:importin subunit beta-1 [Stylonychia lemnae]|uniref:Importin subunit beta-1 n=1 Tax=Stylonychia lemnae TaxID=5949 RepID=A0A078B9F9_STYLE|nr:importin subunit beta-1 [Stylonychia lemnae]|eukprot:CDW91160.1 importin subunit beta-1 [Stylonychia lemnae]
MIFSEQIFVYSCQHVAQQRFISSFNPTLICPLQKYSTQPHKDPETRFHIKEALFSMIKDQREMHVIKAGATCVAAIAVLEIPANMWPELIPQLQNMAQSQELLERLGSLMTLGFICEDIDPQDINPDQMNFIFGALLENVIPEERQLTAISMKAFSRAAHLTYRNFSSEQHRAFIMDKIFLASTVQDEDILQSTMEALNEIARESYDFIGEYIEKIGELTANLINSEFDLASKLAIEIWSTIAEIEYKRQKRRINHLGIIQRYSNAVIKIILTGLDKVNENSIDTGLEELPPNCCIVSAGLALESIARVVGDDCIEVVSEFFGPKLGSPKWTDRFVAIIALASIINPPSTDKLPQMISENYDFLLNMLDDNIERVRQSVAYAYYKLAQNIPEVILSSQHTADLFINKSLIHLCEDPAISTLLVGGLSNLYETANLKDGLGERLIGYTANVLSKIIELIPQEQIHKTNHLQSVIDGINTIQESCSLTPDLMQQLYEFLTFYLTELSKSTIPAESSFKFLNKEQLENVQNGIGGIVQILLIKLREGVNDDLARNILALVGNIIHQHGKMISCCLFILHGLIVAFEDKFDQHMNVVKPWLLSAMSFYEDENSSRQACGLVSDLANYFEKNMCRYSDDFMQALIDVLVSNEHSTETKEHAMIAVGDICLAIEDSFSPYFNKSMDCLMSAAQLTVMEANYSTTNEQINRLKIAILDALISIIHGIHNNRIDEAFKRQIKGYAMSMLDYINSLLDNIDGMPEEFFKNVYNLYLDITQYYGHEMSNAIRQNPATKRLQDGISHVQFEGHDEVSERFMTLMKQIEAK